MKSYERRLFVHFDTERALLVSEDGIKPVKGREVWLPHSKIEEIEPGGEIGLIHGWHVITIPYWLAEEKELIDDA